MIWLGVFVTCKHPGFDPGARFISSLGKYGGGTEVNRGATERALETVYAYFEFSLPPNFFRGGRSLYSLRSFSPDDEVRHFVWDNARIFPLKVTPAEVRGKIHSSPRDHASMRACRYPVNLPAFDPLIPTNRGL